MVCGGGGWEELMVGEGRLWHRYGVVRTISEDWIEGAVSGGFKG